MWPIKLRENVVSFPTTSVHNSTFSNMAIKDLKKKYIAWLFIDNTLVETKSLFCFFHYFFLLSLFFFPSFLISLDIAFSYIYFKRTPPRDYSFSLTLGSKRSADWMLIFILSANQPWHVPDPADCYACM